ncbi:cytoplasmic dynein 1 light intermediate chain 1 [Trichonephila clavata]|uniref:Dynein light intermediate chain n=1 Tax=Trichonephila clavata TaxID=2740835 RepID=A0A8X6KYM7_TRICU|nr:cytoplasmic dynein 1 light intermediate chain 1 [Trichonephila clavata]
MTSRSIPIDLLGYWNGMSVQDSGIKMALMREETTTSPPNDDGKGNKDSFWLQLMAECEANSPNKLPSSKSLLFLGDNDAQKSQLVARLQSSGEKYRKGNGLEYYYLNVRDEYGENQTKLDIWILDDDPSFQRLLKYVLNENTISDTTVILTASMTKPWDIFRYVCTWVEILEKHISTLNIPNEVLEEQKSKVLRRFQEYVEPTMSIYGNLDEQSSSAEIENNLGLEIIVVITETEYMSMLQSEYGYIDEHFDFIQFSLRKFCLTYGAALLYLSLKEDRNCDILLKYLLHKIYSFPFRIPAMFLERDSIFVPAGWDSENKIQALAESLATIAFDSPFEDVIMKPGRLCDNSRVTTEVEAQNDQEFLAAIQAQMLRQPAENNTEFNREGSISATVTSRNPQRRIPRSPQKKQQLEAKLSSGEGDTVLQSFFKSLLKRQTSAPAERPAGFSSTRGQPSTGSSASTNFDRSTSLENTSSAYNKGSLGSKSLGSSVDSSLQTSEGVSLEAVNELNSADSINNRIQREINKNSSDGGNSSDPFSDFIKKYKARGDTGLHNTIPDEEESDVHQLPEYFMSSQSSNYCPADCCFQNNTSNGTATNGSLDADMEPDLDRVKSKFNPPLRLLLESSHETRRMKGNSLKKDSLGSNNMKEPISEINDNPDPPMEPVLEDTTKPLSSLPENSIIAGDSLETEKNSKC